MSIDTKELRRLLAAATPGPWVSRTHNGMPIVYHNGYPVCMAYAGSPCDADFIAATNNVLPALLDALDARAATIAEQAKEIERLTTIGNEMEDRWYEADKDKIRLTAENADLKVKIDFLEGLKTVEKIRALTAENAALRIERASAVGAAEGYREAAMQMRDHKEAAEKQRDALRERCAAAERDLDIMGIAGEVCATCANACERGGDFPCALHGDWCNGEDWKWRGSQEGAEHAAHDEG